MVLALEQAQLAMQQGEVPVGAVVVFQGRVIGTGYNQSIVLNDPGAHAEMVALRAAAKVRQNYRLEGCTLYVTLEPCAMCSGAILQARLARVVYGASEPRTGAAGSVVDLFAVRALNSQTRVDGGVLAADCARLLQDFFMQRRQVQKALHVPLREDALRTPEARFQELPDYPWTGRYVQDLPALKGLRLHFLDLGPKEADCVWLCLHDVPGWSYGFRHLIPIWLAAGHRVVVPDLIGFGRSDKPKKEAVHMLAWHRQVLGELVEALDLSGTRLVLHGLGAGLGLALPLVAPRRYRAVLVLGPRPSFGQTGGTAEPDVGRAPKTRAARPVDPVVRDQRCRFVHQGDEVPFPDRGYQAGVRALPKVVEAQGMEVLLQDVHRILSEAWPGGQGLVVSSAPSTLGAPWSSLLRSAPSGAWQLVDVPGNDRCFTEAQAAEIARLALTALQ